MTDIDKDKYRDTVFLPKTDFPMRGGLPQKEPEILAKWDQIDLYKALRETSKGKPKWILHDGPPYANGNIHIGHAMNKILKDVINRSWQMLGYDAPYVPGWDCHGLPIEWKIEEQYRAKGQDKDTVDKLSFRDECRKFAAHWVGVQSDEFKRLGVTGDWENPYLTMTNAAEAAIAGEIHKFAQNGSLYRGVKPVMWSTVEKTALADAEIEYREHKSATIWVKFPVKKVTDATPAGIANIIKDASIVIWTTTPWTIPGNRAIGFGENISYGIYEVEEVGEGSLAERGERLLIAANLAEAIREQAKIENWQLRYKTTGDMLEGVICAHPLSSSSRRRPGSIPATEDRTPACAGVTDVYDFDVPLIQGDFVTDDAGTGFVHLAPGHGEDDYNLIKEHNQSVGKIQNRPDFGHSVILNPIYDIFIPIESAVDDDGIYTDKHPLFAGKRIFDENGKPGDANGAVIKALMEAGNLLTKGSLRHDYPHSWRSKAPVIFRVTPQWFIAMDDDNAIRDKALSAITETQWVPAQGEKRIRSMVENRPDWCISRQRAWGVPIAVFVEKANGQLLKDPDVFARIRKIFEAEGSDSWWSRPASDFLGDQYNADEYDQVFDIVDVWFESGSTHEFVVNARKELLGEPPVDLYLEGSDQHRGWFQSSLLESCGTRGFAPFKTVLTHGFTLDEKGYKMSKSLGNVVAPQDIIKQYGADILRLWVMTSDYAEDVRIGKNTLKTTADLYRRIRNTLRFLLGALDGFTQDEVIDDVAAMPELDRLALHQLYEMDQKIQTHIKAYEFGKLAHLLHNYCAGELSAFYFDIRKDRLYCDIPDSFERKACRTVLFHIFNSLTSWLAPMLCFTAEEAWGHRPAAAENVESVHLRTYPALPESWLDKGLAGKWFAIRDVRRVVLAALEPKRADKTIGSSLEAHPVIHVSQDYAKALEGQDMAEICITSQATVTTNPAPQEATTLQDVEGVAVVFTLAEGNKCIRCWKVLPEVGTDPDFPDLTLRDAEAVRWYQKRKLAA